MEMYFRTEYDEWIQLSNWLTINEQLGRIIESIINLHAMKAISIDIYQTMSDSQWITSNERPNIDLKKKAL